MRKTTNYKKYASGGAVNTTEINILEPKPHQRPIPPHVPETPMHPVAKMIEPRSALLDHAEASDALQKQIDAQRHAEKMQHQRKLAADFFMHNPDMLKGDNVHDVGHAEQDAIAAGHEPHSPEFYQAVKEGFEKRRLAAVAAENPAPAKPSKTTVSHGDDHHISIKHDEGRFVSAPVSRESASTGYSGNDGPNKVTLTPAHLEHARVSGITPVEYAKQLLRLRKEKADGNYGGQL